MGDGIPPTVLNAAPSPERLAITKAISDAVGGPPLPSIAANISAYADGNAPSPHFDVLVTASTDCSYFVFGVHSLRDNQKKACAFLLDPTKPRVLLNVDRTGRGKDTCYTCGWGTSQWRYHCYHTPPYSFRRSNGEV